MKWRYLEYESTHTIYLNTHTLQNILVQMRGNWCQQTFVDMNTRKIWVSVVSLPVDSVVMIRRDNSWRCLALTTLSDCTINTIVRWKNFTEGWWQMPRCEIDVLWFHYSQLLGNNWWLQLVRSSVDAGRHEFSPWVGKIPWSKGMAAPHPVSCLEDPINRGAVGYSPMGSQRVKLDWATNKLSTVAWILETIKSMNSGMNPCCFWGAAMVHVHDLTFWPLHHFQPHVEDIWQLQNGVILPQDGQGITKIP